MCARHMKIVHHNDVHFSLEDVGAIKGKHVSDVARCGCLNKRGLDRHKNTANAVSYDIELK